MDAGARPAARRVAAVARGAVVARRAASRPRRRRSIRGARRGRRSPAASASRCRACSAWEDLGGRPAVGMLSTRGADVALLAADTLKARHLPASLAPVVVAFAMQDVIDDAPPAYFDDWSAFNRGVGNQPDRMIDYIAALTASRSARPGRGRLIDQSPAPMKLVVGTMHGGRRRSASRSAQAGAPTLRIAAPTEGTYVSGPTRLVAMIDPPTATRTVTPVTFFADGRQVCVGRASAVRVRLGRRRAGGRSSDPCGRHAEDRRQRLVQTVRTQELSTPRPWTSTSCRSPRS